MAITAVSPRPWGQRSAQPGYVTLQHQPVIAFECQSCVAELGAFEMLRAFGVPGTQSRDHSAVLDQAILRPVGRKDNPAHGHGTAIDQGHHESNDRSVVCRPQGSPP